MMFYPENIALNLSMKIDGRKFIVIYSQKFYRRRTWLSSFLDFYVYKYPVGSKAFN